jgi:hypothetical protein
MILKKLIGLSALFFVGISFCAEEEKELIDILEESPLLITSEKYPLLSRFTNFAEIFNSGDIETKINSLYLFYRDTQNYGGKEFRKRKALEVKSIMENLLKLNEITQENETKLNLILRLIEKKHSLRLEIEDNYF